MNVHFTLYNGLSWNVLIKKAFVQSVMTGRVKHIIITFLLTASTCFLLLNHKVEDDVSLVRSVEGRVESSIGTNVAVLPAISEIINVGNLKEETNNTDFTVVQYRAEQGDFRHLSGREYLAKGHAVDIYMYAYSAVIIPESNETTNFTTRKHSHAIHYSAWVNRVFMNRIMKCCYIWLDGHISELLGPIKSYPFTDTQEGYLAVHYKCLVNDPDKLLGCYIVETNANCSVMRHRAMKPSRPVPAPTQSLGVCLKILYGDVDPKLLVDWIEFYKEMKVDKVNVKTYEISPVAKRILDYYAEEGLVDVLPFDVPWRRSHTKPNHGLGYVQERVAILDCHARLRLHTYFTVLDLDEFLFPYQHHDVKELMAHLTAKYPAQHGFLFKSEMYIKDWGETVSNNGSDILRYFKRLGPKLIRPKYIAITSTINDGQLYTHAFNMKKERPLSVQSNVAAVKHYRRCYDDQRVFCNGTRYMDTSILRVVQRFKQRSDLVLKRLSIQ